MYKILKVGCARLRNVYFDKHRKEFFLDRHRKSFEAVCDYYFSYVNDTGALLRPEDVPV